MMKPDETEEVVAELALGGAGGKARSRAIEAESGDPALATAVEALERRLAPLVAVLPPEAPPSGLFERLLLRIETEHVPLPGTTTWRADRYDWQLIAEGVETAVVWRNPKTNRVSSLLRMQPETHYTGHDHDDFEECLVIEGDLAFGELVLKAGDYHVAPPGRSHPPAYSRSGCLCFITAAAA